jgi:hypothetical protein
MAVASHDVPRLAALDTNEPDRQGSLFPPLVSGRVLRTLVCSYQL